MFNTIGRAQGWSDTPLTQAGEEGIRELGIGLREARIPFKAAFSSDSGRTMQTMEIILRETNNENLPYVRDKRIREWCFGSLDGGYDGDLFQGVLPRTAAFNTGKSFEEVTYPELAASIVEVDTANWAEPWQILSKRIYDGFEAMAQEKQVPEFFAKRTKGGLPLTSFILTAAIAVVIPLAFNYNMAGIIIISSISRFIQFIIVPLAVIVFFYGKSKEEVLNANKNFMIDVVIPIIALLLTILLLIKLIYRIFHQFYTYYR